MYIVIVCEYNYTIIVYKRTINIENTKQWYFSCAQEKKRKVMKLVYLSESINENKNTIQVSKTKTTADCGLDSYVLYVNIMYIYSHVCKFLLLYTFN